MAEGTPLFAQETPTGHNLVRLGPPSKGDTIHRAECRFAQRPNALHWKWAVQS